MGVLSAEESREIDALRITNAEIEEEIQRIEKALEAFANAQAIAPDEELKEEIAGKLKFGLELNLDQDKISSIIVELTPLMKFAAAASLAAIIILTGVTIYFSGRLNMANNRIAQLENEKDVLAYQVEALNKESIGLNQQMAALADPATKSITLNGLAISPQSKAIVYWNSQNGSVYINTGLMPVVQADKQFQLWAIVEGKPVSLGLLNKGSTFYQMSGVTKAQAFAITLEPLNGSSVPTLEQMYVLGNV